MSTNKAELVQVNVYGDISAEDEAANDIYIVHFIYVPYTLQKYVELDGNNLASGETLAMKYIHILDEINHDFMSICLLKKL